MPGLVIPAEGYDKMAAMSKHQPTVMEFAIGKAGVLKGGRVCAFIASWTITSQALGRDITIEEYADWWNESERTAYRHLADFRRVFGPGTTPQTIANHAIARAAAHQRGVKGVGALPADLVMA